MNGNIEDSHALLNDIYQGSQMGYDSVHQLIGVADDPKFRQHLSLQQEEYRVINLEAKRLLQQTGGTPRELSAMQELPARMSIAMKTMRDRSPGHMAEMMIEGSTMGIIEATKSLKQHADADPSALLLGQKLLRTEESNVEHLKPFLS